MSDSAQTSTPTPTPDSVDPRLNCAAGICCAPGNALSAATSILLDAGCPDEYAGLCARNLHEMGITFTSTKLARAIAEIADHPGQKGEKS